jgi:hypothetical protein
MLNDQSRQFSRGNPYKHPSSRDDTLFFSECNFYNCDNLAKILLTSESTILFDKSGLVRYGKNLCENATTGII